MKHRPTNRVPERHLHTDDDPERHLHTDDDAERDQQLVDEEYNTDGSSSMTTTVKRPIISDGSDTD